MEKAKCQHATGIQGSCLSCPQRAGTLLNDLGIEELGQLESQRYTATYKAGEAIFREGTKPLGLLCIHSGKIKILRTGPAGIDQIISLHKEGDMIGIRAMIKEHNYSVSAFAIEETQVCIITQEVFKPVLEKNAHLCLKILTQFITQLDASEKLFINHSQKHMSARLADALLYIYSIYGIDHASGYIAVALKRSELAQLANMTTANAIRGLSSFVSEGIIELSGRKIKVLEMEKLNSIGLSGR
jgi:CRP/FNR family transcriptional regulator